MVARNDLMGLNQKLCAGAGSLRRAVHRPLQHNIFRTDEVGEMRRRKVWIEIILNGEETEEKEKGEKQKGGPSYFFQKDQKKP